MSTVTATTNANTTVPITTSAKIDPEKVISYAALILADENLAITPEKLQTLFQAASIDNIEPIWTTLFANALKDRNVKGILTAVATPGAKVGGDTAQDTHCDGVPDEGGAGLAGIDICDRGESEDDATFQYTLFD